MTTHTAYVQGMTTHKNDTINVTKLNEKQLQQMGETWTLLAG